MPCYLPQPTRAWSRVENSCYTNENINLLTIQNQTQMLNKGNVLQYKNNSANLTKSQKYSLMAKGKWINRNTTWATQSVNGYTNPNIKSLKRVQSINITTTGATTNLPITCPEPSIVIYPSLPENVSGDNPQTLPPPPPPPPPEEPGDNPNNVIPIVNDPEADEPIVIPDLGTLICGTQENVCLGEIMENYKSNLNCHPTTDSNVPGTIMDLCWNDGIQSWFPRQRYKMSNSGNKWPVNAILVSAIIPK